VRAVGLDTNFHSILGADVEHAVRIVGDDTTILVSYYLRKKVLILGRMLTRHHHYDRIH
jgi:hypothetical protein